MPFVLTVIITAIIILIIFIGVKASANKSGRSVKTRSAGNYPTIGVNNIPPDYLINSRWYSQYTTCFDLIWWEHKKGNPQDQFKIDCLLESLENGYELENSGTYVLDSMKAGFPYYCDSESEYDFLIDKERSVFQGSVDGMLSMAGYYKYSYKHSSKLDCWRDQLSRSAEAGNLYAQAALTGFRASLAFDEQEITRFKSRYESRVNSAATTGNLEAQLAMIKYWHSPVDFDRTKVIKSIAERLDSSDAWYQLSVEYFMKAYSPTNPPSEEDKSRYENLRWSCFVKGADADNGAMAGYCQYMAGIHVEDDDPSRAKRWYEMAAGHGLDVKYLLENVQ